MFICFLEGRHDPSKYHYKRTIIGPPAKWHSPAGRCWPNFENWFGSFEIFQRSGFGNIAKKIYIFVIFQGGDPLGSPLPPLDSHMTML